MTQAEVNAARARLEAEIDREAERDGKALRRINGFKLHRRRPPRRKPQTSSFSKRACRIK